MRLLLLVLYFTIATAQAQCEFKSLVPFEFGISKFKASEKAQTLDLLFPKYRNYESRSEWKREKYMKNDSVYFSQLALDLKRNSCFLGMRNYMSVNFADDKLYKIEITFDFDGEAYSEMIQAYNSLKKVIAIEYPIVQVHDEKDSHTGEQLKSGFKFLKDSSPTQTKPRFATLSYRMVYKNSESSFGGQTKQINVYKIEIVLVNLNGTKYTAAGYY